MALERQELHCHGCNRYVQFSLDVSLNGNHVLECPNCGHEHCRVVKDGKITDIRWASRNGPTHVVTWATSTTASTWVTSGARNYFLYNAWMNTGAT